MVTSNETEKMKIQPQSLVRKRQFGLAVLFLLAFAGLDAAAATKLAVKKGRPLPAAVIVDGLLACIEEVHPEINFGKQFRFQYWYGAGERSDEDHPDEIFIILYTRKPDEAMFWDVMVHETNGKPHELNNINGSRLKRNAKGKWVLVDIWDGGWTGEYSTRAINILLRTRMQKRSPKPRRTKPMTCLLQYQPVWP